jgi:hypothetical protein
MTYKPARDRGDQAESRSGLLARFRSMGPHRAMTGRHGHGARRRDRLLLASLLVAIVASIGCVAGGYLYYRNDRDWTAVASVNGHDISREALRGRMAVLAFLAQERASFVSQQSAAGRLSANEYPTLTARANAPLTDLVDAARESLIDDELLRQLASSDGVPTPPTADPAQEGAAFAAGDMAQRIRYVRFGLPTPSTTGQYEGSSSADGSGAWPAASSGNLAAATDRLQAELTFGTSASDIVAGLEAAGWQVAGEDVSLWPRPLEWWDLRSPA